MANTKIRTGFRVVGHNTSDGDLHSWFFPSLELANAFAQQLCQDTGKEVDVCKYLGSWRRVEPVEFVAAKDV
jgi:hypothetical protein